MRRLPTSLLLVLWSAMAAQAGERSFEQTFEVEPGAWLEVDCPHGRVYVAGWERETLEVVATHDPEGGVEARTYRGDVRVSPSGDKHRKTDIEYVIQAPLWLNVSVLGNHTSVEIDGLRGRVEVETVKGNVRIFGGREEVYVRTVQGWIEVEGAEGDIDVDSQNDDVTLTDCKGEILAESLNGELHLENVDAIAVEANALNGDIYYNGALASTGEYFFMTHAGDIQVGVPREADLTVTVISYQGDFTSDFDVEVPDGKDRFKFTLGNGKGKLYVESFQGDIELFEYRPGRRYRRD